MICRFFATGILGLTIVYVAFVVALNFLAPQCLDEPCGSEGVDNSIVNWGADFYVAAFLFAFGFHLVYISSEKLPIRKSGILAQIFMGGSFLLTGICNWMFSNNGVGDGKGMIGFWIFWAVASSFFCFSALNHSLFAKEASKDISWMWKPCCAGTWLKVFQFMIVSACTFNVAGCIWCAAVPEFHVTEKTDAFEDLASLEDPTCVRFVTVSQNLLWFSYALLWAPTGLLLKAAAEQNPVTILGLSTPIAAGSTILFQWSVGSFYFACLGFTAWVRGEDFLELYEKAYGAEIVHYGLLMTFYCAHNLSWSLTIPRETRLQLSTKPKPKSANATSSVTPESEKGILKHPGNPPIGPQKDVETGGK